MIGFPLGENWIHLSTWLDWSSWLVGVRVDWQTYMRFVVVELGPIGLGMEYDSAADDPTSADTTGETDGN